MTKTFDELLESVNVGDTVTGFLKADLKTIHHQELQKAREEEREKIFGDIEQFKTEVETMDYCDDFKDGIYATIEHILSMPVFESVLNQAELDQDKV